MGAVEKRVARWLDLASACASRPSALLPRHAIAEELAATFGSQVSWNWMNPDGDHGFDLHTPIPGWPTPEIVSRLDVMVSDHPLIEWYAASGQLAPMSIGRVPPVLISRLGREIVNEYLVPVRMEQQLSIPIGLLPANIARSFWVGAGTISPTRTSSWPIAFRGSCSCLTGSARCCVVAGPRVRSR